MSYKNSELTVTAIDERVMVVTASDVYLRLQQLILTFSQHDSSCQKHCLINHHRLNHDGSDLLSVMIHVKMTVQSITN
jgi:hypothetical protein